MSFVHQRIFKVSRPGLTIPIKVRAESHTPQNKLRVFVEMPLHRIPLLILASLIIITVQVYLYAAKGHSGVEKVLLKEEGVNEVRLVDIKTAEEDIKKGSRAKAAIVILARNSDLEGLEKSIPQFEKVFNKKYQYPYVFLNEVLFTEKFKSKIAELTTAPIKFGLIPVEHWSYPEWIDQKYADKSRADMERRNIIYGGSLSYRNMCRFNSGFFFRHELLKECDYYWRVEPWVEFYCDMAFDPFVFMRDNGKVYGFTIMLKEYIETIPTLWKATKDFMKSNSNLISKNNTMKMLTDDKGEYNLCHFWSNFEIGDLNFFRSERYLEYFDHLDRAGGFFYERWGDAPVHSLAIGMFVPKEQIHFFENIGYFHGPYMNCPSSPVEQLYCKCDASKSVNIGNECINAFKDLFRG